MKKLISLIVGFENEILYNHYLNIRYTLADTIENRNLGVIVNEGSGVGFMEVKFESIFNHKMEMELHSLILSLGILDATEIIIEII